MKRDIAQVAYGNRNWSTGIQGSPPSFLDVRDWRRARAAASFSQSEEDSAAKVALLGQTVVDNLFAPGEDPSARPSA